MFNDDNKKMAPKQGYHSQTQRHASKIHYTVTPIADLKAWKADQAQKEAAWLKGRPERYAAVRAVAVDIVQGQTTRLKDDKETHYLDQVAALTLAPKGKFVYKHVEAPTQSPKSWIQKVKELFNVKLTRKD